MLSILLYTGGSTDDRCLEKKNLVKEYNFFGGAHDVMVIIIGNGHGDTSSNPGRGWLHFT